MAKKLNLNIDLSRLSAQFQGLQGRHPGLWPALPRGTLLATLVVAILAAAHFLYWQGLFEDLDARRAEEETLKAKFVENMKQAVNLEVLRKQKEQVSLYVGQLEKQLPSKAEMDALLSDINQAGVGRGLEFESFKPGGVQVKEYYAELPIKIRLLGSYHDLSAFTSDVSNMSRIVTLNNMNLAVLERDKEKSGKLALEATAKTFRYLDPEEIAAQRREQAKAKQGAPK